MRFGRAIVTISTGLLIGMVGLAPTSSSAYNLRGCKYPNGAGQDVITYYIPSPSIYFSPTSSAATAWNSATTKIKFTYTGGAPGEKVLVRALNYGNVTFDGLTTATCSGGLVQGTQTSDYNTYFTGAYSTTKRKQLMVHELGHALGLAEGAANCTNIMNPTTPGRFVTCGLSTPQTDDTNGVAAMYP